MTSLWRWLKTWGLEHQAVTGEAPSDHPHPRGTTPIGGMTEADYLWLLINT
jgi:hypothetical protein